MAASGVALVGLAPAAAVVEDVATAPPASAETCFPERGWTVRKGSSVFNTTLYRWTHLIGSCKNGFRIYSDRTYASNVDFTWSYEGESTNNTWYSPDKKYYYSQKGGHFQQCFFFYCTNLYPDVNLRAEYDGDIWVTFTDAG